MEYPSLSPGVRFVLLLLLRSQGRDCQSRHENSKSGKPSSIKLPSPSATSNVFHHLPHCYIIYDSPVQSLNLDNILRINCRRCMKLLLRGWRKQKKVFRLFSNKVLRSLLLFLLAFHALSQFMVISNNELLGKFLLPRKTSAKVFPELKL
jgi:hypothetical protein